MYNFDEQIDRRGSYSVKYDSLTEVFGRDDILPMWVADMDFKTAPAVLKAVRDAAEHGVKTRAGCDVCCGMDRRKRGER